MKKRIDISQVKTVYLVGEKGGEYRISLEVEASGKVRLLNERGEEEFVFSNENSEGTMERWERVVRLMGFAVDFLKKGLAPKGRK